jgi:hypothetical protein
MTKSWLKHVTVAAALFIGGGLASAHAGGGGGGTDPDRDTGTPPAVHGKTTSTDVQRKSTTTTDSRTTPANVKRSRDLENAPGGTDETSVPNADGARH